MVYSFSTKPFRAGLHESAYTYLKSFLVPEDSLLERCLHVLHFLGALWRDQNSRGSNLIKIGILMAKNNSLVQEDVKFATCNIESPQDIVGIFVPILVMQ